MRIQWTLRSGLLSFGVVLFMYLQYLFWLGEGGVYDRYKLKLETQHVMHNMRLLEQRNLALTAEVSDLKQGIEAIEEYARLDLGLIKPGEYFIQKSSYVGSENSIPGLPTTNDAAPKIIADDHE